MDRITNKPRTSTVSCTRTKDNRLVVGEEALEDWCKYAEELYKDRNSLSEEVDNLIKQDLLERIQ